MMWWADLAEQWNNQSWLELVAVVTALAYVWLAARQVRWCWPAAFVSTSIYTYLYLDLAAPMQAFLNAYYLVMAVYGWWSWQHGEGDGPLQVGSRSIAFHGVAVASLLLLSVAATHMSVSGSVSTLEYADTLITVFSLFATWLVAQKVLQNWLYWIGIDALAVWFNWQLGLYLTSLLMGLYVIMAVYGYHQWQQSTEADVATA